MWYSTVICWWMNQILLITVRSHRESFPDETIISMHLWVDDPQLEMERLKSRKEEAQKEMLAQYDPFGYRTKTVTVQMMTLTIKVTRHKGKSGRWSRWITVNTGRSVLNSLEQAAHQQGVPVLCGYWKTVPTGTEATLKVRLLHGISVLHLTMGDPCRSKADVERKGTSLNWNGM